MPAIERWFRLEWMEHTPPFYTSVDIRNAGFKLAPVDTNLYPGGWNNLTPRCCRWRCRRRWPPSRRSAPKPQPADHPGKPHPQHLLPEQSGAVAAHLPHGRPECAHRLDRPGHQESTTIDLPNGDQITLEPVIRSKREGAWA
jgi:glutamate--cysteine ligase